ncbi:MAG TPA: M36 family metallopeptidase [Solirubrobacter sp.]|nr:M36 family metallopeptidase [Solirubrobacter sp.]
MTALVAACALAAPAAAHADARDIAREYLNANPGKFGVTAADVADAFVMSSYKTSGTGVTHVNFNQRYKDLEVFGGHATINVGPDGRVIFTGGRLVRLQPATSARPRLGTVEAIEATARKLKLDEPAKLRVLERESGPVDTTVLSTGGISGEPIESRLGWWPENGRLRLAYQNVIDDTESSSLWAATVDATTGALLHKDDWTSHDNVKELRQRLDRQGEARRLAPAFQAFALGGSPSPVVDGSRYRVFAWPNESPNDADRTLVANPADSVASPRGWHDINNSGGADFTTTQGNNVHAYLDQDSNNAPDYRSEPSGGASLRFDFPLDLAQHAQANRDAAVTNLFYSNNMIHDVLYRYGFDDASGNFQENNYGRGGTGGDPVQAEAADGSGTNNANFSTPAADGGKPRMQMYLWPGNQLGPQNQLVIDGGSTYGASWARFTPPVMSSGLPGRTLVYGGTGCTESAYPASRPGENWIAVVDGGTTPCSYLQRVEVAQSLNADAVVVVDTGTSQTPPILAGSMIDQPVVIPAVAVNSADGAALKALIAAGPAPTANLRMNPDRAPIRDGDIDNGIVIHEYGHGVSNRLTGGPKTSNCLSGNEQAGEGWSDFFAITFMLDPRLDKPEGTRGLVPYALFQSDRTQNGLRPRPYSRNMEIQPFTYDSIKSNGWLNGTSLALPHGLGHGWAAVLWDMTWDLIDKHGFNANLYGDWSSGGNNRAIQYVVDGLKMQGCFPGLIVSRDAIIAAAEARNPGVDTCTIWATFARRGFGYSAVQGTTDRNDNAEAFDTHPDCRRNFQAPVLPEPALNDRPAGSTVELRFTAEGYRGLDVLAENQPYSRLVDCETLQTVNPGQTTITPRPFPLKANGALSVNDRGIFTFPWQTEAGWSGTCRELVATADSGKQYRAYFRFT